jgi:hypothetical protein
MLFRIGKDVILSSWYHYKSRANMKVSLSWMIRLMKQMFRMVPLQVTCQHMDENEFKLNG